MYIGIQGKLGWINSVWHTVSNQTYKGDIMQYWIVGATWGEDNLANRFYLRGSWQMGYAEKDKPGYAEKIKCIKQGDRIAVKKRDGKGATTISIKAIGIVKDVEEGIVYIDWIAIGLDRHVSCKNYFGTIHGPVNDEVWRNEAFCL